MPPLTLQFRETDSSQFIHLDAIMGLTTANKTAALSIRVLRQDSPGKPPRWERHRIPYEPNLNVISVLQKIAAQATTEDGSKTTPVAWDCNCLEEVCGACTML